MVRQSIYEKHGEYNYRKSLVSMAKSSGLFDTLEQQAFTVDTEGIARRIAGLALYNQVNMKTPIIGALPDIDRTQDDSIDVDSDSPAATFRTVFNPPSTSGVAGGGNVPDAVRWETRSVEARVKIIAMAIESDFVHEIEHGLGHDTVGFEQLMELGEQYVDRSLERDNVARMVTAGGDSYTDDDMVVPLDRVVASQDEEDNARDAAGDEYQAGDLSVYSVDRSATGAGGSNQGNYFDATVNHGSGSLRQLTSDLLNDSIDTQVQDSSAEYDDLIILTGRDTARVMSDLKESQFRADALQQAGRESVNDAETRFGHNFTARISHWDGIEVVPVPSVPGASLSRIFILDTTPGKVPGEQQALPKIGIETYRSPDVWTAGPDQDVHPLATGQIASEAAWAMYPEVVMRDARAQQKITEIEE